MKTRPYNLTVRAQADGEYEISIRGVIGAYLNNDWTMSDTEADVLAELAKIPVGKKINARLNSVGGSSQLGLGIYNAFNRRRADVTTYNDGFACSAAAIVMLAGSRRVCPTASMMMIHPSASVCDGTAVDMRTRAECLETIDDLSAALMAEIAGKKTKEEYAALLAKTTWMTGEQALELGFATENTGEIEEEDDDDAATAKAKLEIVARYKNAPKNLLATLEVRAQAVQPPPTNQPKQTPKNMKLIIAALVAAGISCAAEATEDVVLGHLNPILAENSRLKEENKKHVEARKTRVTAVLATALTDKVVTEARQTSLLALGSRDAEGETEVLAQIGELRAAKVTPAARGTRPARQEGEPAADVTAARLEEIQAELSTKGITAEQRSKLTAESLKLRGLDQLFAEPAQK